MIIRPTHLKFEAKIPNGSKFLSLKANLTLKVKVIKLIKHIT